MSLELPRTWSRMGFTAKAGWLAARLGISYEDACSMLRKRARGRRNKPAAVYNATDRTKNYWWNREH